jgi:hypothetical protein
MAYLHSFGIQFFVYLLFKNCCNLSLNTSGAYLYNSELILPTSEILLFFANFKVFFLNHLMSLKLSVLLSKFCCNFDFFMFVVFHNF